MGQLEYEGNVLCFTLEDRLRRLRDDTGLWHPEWKIPKETAIPAGRYRLVCDESQRFKRVLPRVCDVPLFAGIRWHAGNTEHDTEGCLLVGERRGDDRLLDSADALTFIFPIVRSACARGETWVEYIDVDPPAELLIPAFTPAKLG